MASRARWGLILGQISSLEGFGQPWKRLWSGVSKAGSTEQSVGVVLRTWFSDDHGGGGLRVGTGDPGDLFQPYGGWNSMKLQCCVLGLCSSPLKGREISCLGLTMWIPGWFGWEGT